MSEHAQYPNDVANKAGLHWSESHCDENIFAFTEGVRELRAKLEPAGCKVTYPWLTRCPHPLCVCTLLSVACALCLVLR